MYTCNTPFGYELFFSHVAAIYLQHITVFFVTSHIGVQPLLFLISLTFMMWISIWKYCTGLAEEKIPFLVAKKEVTPTNNCQDAPCAVQSCPLRTISFMDTRFLTSTA